MQRNEWIWMNMNLIKYAKNNQCINITTKCDRKIVIPFKTLVSSWKKLCSVLLSFTPKITNSNERSSNRSCSVKRDVLRNFAKFTGKHLCQSLFFNKVAGLMPKSLLKKKLWRRCFPVNSPKFLRKNFLKEQLRWLFL